MRRVESDQTPRKRCYPPCVAPRTIDLAQFCFEQSSQLLGKAVSFANEPLVEGHANSIQFLQKLARAQHR